MAVCGIAWPGLDGYGGAGEQEHCYIRFALYLSKLTYPAGTTIPQ